MSQVRVDESFGVSPVHWTSLNGSRIPPVYPHLKGGASLTEGEKEKHT